MNLIPRKYMGWNTNDWVSRSLGSIETMDLETMDEFKHNVAADGTTITIESSRPTPERITVWIAGKEFVLTAKPAEPPAPAPDPCERPEPETGTTVCEARTWKACDAYAYNRESPWMREAWEMGHLHLTSEAAKRAAEMTLLRHRALTARDAINGERGLRGERNVGWAVDPGGELRSVARVDLWSEWRFHSMDDANRWLTAIGGPDAFKRLIGVTV